MQELIINIARSLGVPAQLLLAICTQESNLKNTINHHDGGSPSYGVCQLKSNTAKMVGFQGNPIELMDVSTNIYWSGRYLAYQQTRYGNNWNKLAASFNAGSYNPSDKVVGCPRNLKYVRAVQSKLPKAQQHKMNCGT